MTQTRRSRELAREIERERCKPNKIHTRERETKRKIVIVAFICCTTERRIVVIEEERGKARVGGVELQAKGSVARV